MSRLLPLSLFAVLALSLFAGAEQPPPPQPVPGADKAKIDELVQKLASDDWDERGVAEKELQAIGKPAVAAIQKAMETSEDPEVKVRAKRILQNLGEFKAPELTDEQFEQMCDLLRTQDGVSWYRNNEKPNFYLYQLNEKPEWNEALKGKGLAPRLAKALGDDSGNLKRNAAYLLGEMGASEIAPQVAKLLKDEEMMTRAVAAFVLGRLGNFEIADQVVIALTDNETKVRCAAAAALEFLPTAAAIEPLLGAMAADDADVRFQAYYSLRSLTGQGFRFNAWHDEAARKEEMKSIEDWWSKSKSGFKPLPPKKREEVGEREPEPGEVRMIRGR